MKRIRRSKNRILPPDFYLQSTRAVAQGLLRKILVRRFENGTVIRARIVETEAYLGLKDPACHSYHGKRTDRVAALYLPGGHVYVYLIYGMYYCLNVVTRPHGVPEAVLIRGVELIDPPPGFNPYKSNRIDGPGRLAKVLEVRRDQNGLCLFAGSPNALWIEEPDAKLTLRPKERVVTTARIGLGVKSLHARDWELRFVLSPTQSAR